MASTSATPGRNGPRCTGAGPHKIGSQSIRKLVDETLPLAHIHGHSHSGFGRDGRHFNIALARSKRAILIDLASLDSTVVAASDPKGSER